MGEVVNRSGASRPRLLLFAASAFAVVVLVVTFFDLLPAGSGLRLALGLGAAALIVVAAALYLLAPLFSGVERARAREAYGTHRDVLANGVTAVAIGQLVLLPILLFLLSLSLHWQEGLGAVWSGVFSLLGEATPMVLFLALLGLDTAFILVVYLRLVRTGATTGRGLGLVADRFWRNVGLGVAGWVMIIVASLIIASVLMPVLGTRQQQAELKVIGAASPAIFYLIFAAGSLLAPFTEELFFRGYIFRAYASAKGVAPAYVLSATVFALPHLNPTSDLPTNVALFIPLAVIGGILAYLLRRSGSLVAPVTAHGLNNAMALLAVYALVGATG